MIERLNKDNFSHCMDMGVKLWPSITAEELYEEYKVMDNEKWVTFLYKSGDEYAGFISVALRSDYVEGSSSCPVAYIEAIYVEEAYRRKGIAAELVIAAENWGIEKGCVEIGSDCESTNQLSIDFHIASGFEEAERIVCFIKPLKL